MEHITLLIIGLIIGYLGIIFNFLGWRLNVIAYKSNGNKMPVLVGPNFKKKKIKNTEHFKFTKKTQVKNYYLCDIFKQERKKEVIYFSIGDVILYLSFPFVVLGYFLILLSLFLI